MGGGWLLQWLLSVVAVYEQMSGRWLVVAVYEQMSGRWLVVAVAVVSCCSV